MAVNMELKPVLFKDVPLGRAVEFSLEDKTLLGIKVSYSLVEFRIGRRAYLRWINFNPQSLVKTFVN